MNAEQILNFIYTEIINNNYEIKSIDEVCKTLKISKKTFYIVFKSKEDFTIQLLKLFTGINFFRLVAIGTKSVSMIEKVIETYDLILLTTITRNATFKNQYTNTKPYIDEVNEYENKAILLLNSLFEEGIQQQIISINSHTNLFSKYSINFISSSLNQDSNNNDAKFITAVRFLIVTYLKGVFVETEHKKLNEILSKIIKIENQ